MENSHVTETYLVCLELWRVSHTLRKEFKIHAPSEVSPVKHGSLAHVSGILGYFCLKTSSVTRPVPSEQESIAGVTVPSTPFLYRPLTGLHVAQQGRRRCENGLQRGSGKRREDFKSEERENERKVVVIRNG